MSTLTETMNQMSSQSTTDTHEPYWDVLCPMTYHEKENPDDMSHWEMEVRWEDGHQDDGEMYEVLGDFKYLAGAIWNEMTVAGELWNEMTEAQESEMEVVEVDVYDVKGMSEDARIGKGGWMKVVITRTKEDDGWQLYLMVFPGDKKDDDEIMA